MNPFNNNYFKLGRYSTVVYNNFNEETGKKISDILTKQSFIVQQFNVEGQSYFGLIHEGEFTKTDFLTEIRNSISSLLKELKVQLISIDFEDAIGLVMTTDNKIKPLGLTIKNVPLVGTNIEGDFIARPKTLDDCVEVMKVAYEHDKYQLIYAEFGKRFDNNTGVISIEKTDRFPILYAKTTNNVLV